MLRTLGGLSVPLLRAWHSLIDLVFPPRCLVCHRPPRLGRDWFCDDCRSALLCDPSLACPRCAFTVGPFGAPDGRCPTCRDQPLGFDAALRLGPYDGTLERAVLKIKHAVHEGLAEALGHRWAESRRADFKAVRPDVIVSVPLHWRKRFWRGYNQSEAIAFGLGAALGCPCRPRWLRRTRATADQKAMLSSTARRENVKDAFVASGRVSGLRVLLVDDVMTTGATASEAAKALTKAGANGVAVAVLARAGR